MKLLKNIILYGSLVASLLLYYHVDSKKPCNSVITYDIGQFDEEYGMTRDSFLTYIALAEIPWEEVAQKQLFRYEEGADFKVNLIFSDKQEKIQKGNELENRLDEKERSLSSTKQQYEDAVEKYERDKSNYERKLARYQKEVDRWNQQGGAPSSVFNQLEKDFEELQKEAESLNSSITRINDLARQSNSKVLEFNQNADEYNNLFDGTAFDAGNTDGTEINVYSFSNTKELVTLLTHEFGHVLGIDHIEDEASVMHYLLHDENVSGELSSFDKEALMTSCRI